MDFLSAAINASSVIGQNHMNKWATDRANFHNTNMYHVDQFNARQNAKTAWERSMDYKTLIQNAKGAGINPYAVVGNNPHAPMASGSGPQRQERMQYDLGGMQTAMLMAAQVEQLQANTKKTEAETIGQSIANRYAGRLSEAQIGNITAMAESQQQTKKLLEQQTTLANRQGLIAHIDAGMRQAMLDADLAKTEAEKIEVDKRITNLTATYDKIRTEITYINQQIELGKMSVREGEARIKVLQEDAVNKLYERRESQSRTYRNYNGASNENSQNEFNKGENFRRDAINDRDEIRFLKEMFPTKGQNGWYKF